MQQLLKITTVPIQYELKVQHARYERKSSTAELEIYRNEGGLQIKSRPIRLNMDTYEARNSVVPTTKTAIYQAADRGMQQAQEAAAAYAQEGRILLSAKKGQGAATIDQILENRLAMPTGQFRLDFIPKAGPNIQWEPPALSIEYEMDKLQFDLKVDKGRVEFIPGSVEVAISQQPDIVIEYIGEPMYVPPSVAEVFTGKGLDVLA